MEIIKNIYKLMGIVQHIDLLRLEEGAKQYLIQLNISFEILSAKPTALKIKTRQWKCRSGNYAEIPKLITVTQELFQRFMTDIPVTVHPISYIPAVVDDVGPEWVNDKMTQTGVTITDLQRDTGVDKMNLTSWIEGIYPMSQDVKAMFFYYFESAGHRLNQRTNSSEFKEPCYN